MHAIVFEKPGDATLCASYHRDRKGPMGLARQDSPLCTQCHAGLQTKVPQTTNANISDFSKGHPPFKLSMLVPGKTGAAGIVSVSQDAPQLAEKSKTSADIAITDLKTVRAVMLATSPPPTTKCAAPVKLATAFMWADGRAACLLCYLAASRMTRKNAQPN